jgi:hypothetical protein
MTSTVGKYVRYRAASRGPQEVLTDGGAGADIEVRQRGTVSDRCALAGQDRLAGHKARLIRQRHAIGPGNARRDIAAYLPASPAGAPTTITGSQRTGKFTELAMKHLA